MNISAMLAAAEAKGYLNGLAHRDNCNELDCMCRTPMKIKVVEPKNIEPIEEIKDINNDDVALGQDLTIHLEVKE